MDPEDLAQEIKKYEKKTKQLFSYLNEKITKKSNVTELVWKKRKKMKLNLSNTLNYHFAATFNDYINAECEKCYRLSNEVSKNSRKFKQFNKLKSNQIV